MPNCLFCYNKCKKLLPIYINDVNILSLKDEQLNLIGDTLYFQNINSNNINNLDNNIIIGYRCCRYNCNDNKRLEHIRKTIKNLTIKAQGEIHMIRK